MDKELVMQRLVDTQGFSYADAKAIVKHPDAPQILDYIQTAYAKGKRDGKREEGGRYIYNNGL